MLTKIIAVDCCAFGLFVLLSTVLGHSTCYTHVCGDGVMFYLTLQIGEKYIWIALIYHHMAQWNIGTLLFFSLLLENVASISHKPFFYTQIFIQNIRHVFRLYH